MMKRCVSLVAATLLLLFAAASWADDYSDTIEMFKNAGASREFFDKAYGYAVFPGIGKGGFIVGGAHGTGRVYEHGQYVGDVSMTQVSVGLQAGGQGFRQIIFFEDKRAFDEFTSGSFEFGADASAVAITAAAGASGGQKDATTAGKYYKGMATFTIVKGGAMYQAAISGQKFKYTPKA